MAKCRLRLFGGFQLSSGEGEEITSLGRRDRALLAYLALVPGHRENRERLATLLWSRRGEEQARHSLAQSTAALRKALGDSNKTVVLSEADGLAIDWSGFEVDVTEFRELLTGNTREALQGAIALYSHDLLNSFETRSEGFDEWLESERIRYRGMAIEAHCRLASLQAHDGDWKSVIDTASRTLVMDSLREDAHRLLMRAYAQTGQRALAMQQYKQLAEILDSELQVQPDPATEALIEDIRAGNLRTDPSAKELAPEAIQVTPNSTAASDPPRSSRLWSRLFWGAGSAIAILLAAAVGMTATFWRVPELAPAPIGAYIRGIKTKLQPHPLSIAILTFESHGDPDAADFAEALSGGITTALSISSEMRVTSRNEARRFESGKSATEETARLLKVRYLLEGSVTKWGNQITVETGLVDTGQGQHRIWSDAYRHQVADFIQFQQDVTFDIIRSLEIRLTEGEQERISRMGGTESLEAWLAAARGEKHLRLLTAQNTLAARASYERAIALDPDYAGALEGLAWTYFVDTRFGWTRDREESLQRARELGERALAIDPERAQTLSLLGSISLLGGDFSKAIELGERAFSLDPNDSDIAALLAYTLTYTGEPERAISLVQRAISLRPVAPQWYEWLRGRAYRLSGRSREAIEILTAATKESPVSPVPLIELAAAYSEVGQTELARRTANEIIRLSPKFTVGEWITLSPYRDEKALNQEVSALRATGLPN